MFVSWQESYDKPRQCVKEQRHSSADKVHTVKAMVSPVVTYGCESWTVKKTEYQRIGVFELWCCRRLLKVFWTERSNQSIIREVNIEDSLERLMLKLKLQYFNLLMWTADSLEKILMLVKIEGKRGRGCQRMRWHPQCNGHELGQTPGDVKGQGGLTVHGVTKSQTLLDDWTTTTTK